MLLAIRSRVSHIKCGRHGLDAPLTSGYVLAPAPLRECGGTMAPGALLDVAVVAPKRSAHLCGSAPPSDDRHRASGSRPEGPHGSGVNGLTVAA